MGPLCVVQAGLELLILLPEKQAGNCGVTIVGWKSSRLRLSYCAEDETTVLELTVLMKLALNSQKIHLPLPPKYNASPDGYGILLQHQKSN